MPQPYHETPRVPLIAELEGRIHTLEAIEVSLAGRQDVPLDVLSEVRKQLAAARERLESHVLWNLPQREGRPTIAVVFGAGILPMGIAAQITPKTKLLGGGGRESAFVGLEDVMRALASIPGATMRRAIRRAWDEAEVQFAMFRTGEDRWNV